MRSFPAVPVYGPRQCGRSTLARTLAGLRQCMAGLSLKRGFVIMTGDERRSVGKAIEILPWQALARGQVDIG